MDKVTSETLKVDDVTASQFESFVFDVAMPQSTTPTHHNTIMVDRHDNASTNQRTGSKRARRRRERERIASPVIHSSKNGSAPNGPSCHAQQHDAYEAMISSNPNNGGRDDSSPSSLPALRRPRVDVESMIDAAIEARRRQHQELERYSAALALADEASSVAPNSSYATEGDHGGDDDNDQKELSDDNEGYHYEYLDHTADVQLHSWGSNLERALEGLVVAMFGYMTDLRRIHPDNSAAAKTVRVRAHDAPSLVFGFLQEWLSQFHENGFVPRSVRVTRPVDRSEWVVEATGSGEVYDPSRHTQGTEVKAVTYGSLRVLETESSDSGTRCDIWVIVDI
jgi:SHS2 domain-containing protein